MASEEGTESCIWFKSSLNPNIDMENGAKFSVLELKKEHLLLSKYNSSWNKNTMLFLKA